MTMHTGEFENKYQNEAKGIFIGQRYCMKTRRKELSLFQNYFRIPFYVQFASNFDAACRTIQSVSVPSLQLLGPIELEL